MTKITNVYHVYEADDRGFPSRTLAYVKATSRNEARELLSVRYYGTKESELVNSGYYGASLISLLEKTQKKEKLRKQLRTLENIL